jgi:signal transduction histidine kinase
MRLAEFIRINNDQILQEWEEFARKISDTALPRWALRDHAGAIIKFTSERMEAAAPPVQQRLTAAAEGEPPRPIQSVTDVHVKLRIDSGFDLAEIIAEYCALRACVIRLWRERDPESFHDGSLEVTRFAEVVDENITAAAANYIERESQYRDRFLGILGHDLRNPINAIVSNATLLGQLGSSEQQLKIVARILNSARQLTSMANDILDFARGRLDSPMPLTLAAANMGAIVREVIDQVQVVNPIFLIESALSGDLSGNWDADRLKQMITNLLLNAIQHGTGREVQVTAKGDESVVELQVHNQGPALPQDLLPTIFDPLVRGSSPSQDSTSLGLGLFIVNEIVSAHKGTIAVSSSENAGTTFVVRLPRGRH